MMFNESSIQRRQTARESTGPLKGWLQEHPRNPYPTKAEKVMLALISGMTLTQVSTWFANARRRLKKENGLKEDTDESIDDKESVDQDMIGLERTPNLTSIYTSPSVIQERKREAEQIEKSQNSGKSGNLGATETKKEKIWRIVDQIK